VHLFKIQIAPRTEHGRRQLEHAKNTRIRQRSCHVGAVGLRGRGGTRNAVVGLRRSISQRLLIEIATTEARPRH